MYLITAFKQGHEHWIGTTILRQCYITAPRQPRSVENKAWHRKSDPYEKVCSLRGTETSRAVLKNVVSKPSVVDNNQVQPAKKYQTEELFVRCFVCRCVSLVFWCVWLRRTIWSKTAAPELCRDKSQPSSFESRGLWGEGCDCCWYHIKQASFSKPVCLWGSLLWSLLDIQKNLGQRQEL